MDLDDEEKKELRNGIVGIEVRRTLLCRLAGSRLVRFAMGLVKLLNALNVRTMAAKGGMRMGYIM